MKITDLPTPMILVDTDTLNQNIKNYQQKCDDAKKELWPMIKTHKSTQIAKMQLETGATGFLCGTLDECEKLVEIGVKNIMYAYPVATDSSIKRVIDLSKNCRFIARIDNLSGAEILNKKAQESQVNIDYTIIINSGLNRLGVLPEDVVSFAKELSKLKQLNFIGISTHPGHVYAATNNREVKQCSLDEKVVLEAAAQNLKKENFDVKLITSGSTPTFENAVNGNIIHILHPGNYVFHDAIQIALGVVTENECALTILASVISNPRTGEYIIDAGSKTLGLDKGAHGNTSIKGFGIVKGHPTAEIVSLSEEVGKIGVTTAKQLQVGDKIEIIPNHACVPANLTARLISHRNGLIEGSIEIDMRGNSNFHLN